MDDEFIDHCRYVGLLCRQEDFHDTYKEKIQLFPPDVEKKLESGEKRSDLNCITEQEAVCAILLYLLNISLSYSLEK